MNPYSAVFPNNQPDPLQSYLQLKAQQEQQQRYQEQLELQQQRYRDGLLSDVAGRLDVKHYLSGTPFDPIIEENISTALKQVAETFKNKGAYSDGLLQAMNAASEIVAYANKAKQLKANIEEGAKAFQRDPSIDWQRLAKEAMVRASMTVDEKGLVTLKDPREIDPGFDYLNDVLEKNPEAVTTGLGSLYSQIEKSKYIPYKGEISRDVGGVKQIRAYEGKYDPLFNELINSKGDVVNDNTATGLRVKGVPVNLGGQTVTGVPDEVVSYFYQSPGTKAAIRAESKRMMHFLPAGTRLEDVERFVLHRELSNSANSYINKTKDDYDTSQLQSELFRKEMKSLYGSSGKSEGKETFIDSLYRVKAGDDNYLGSKYEEVDAPSNDFYDVSKYMPDGRLYGINKPNKNGIGTEKAEYNRVGFDKKTGLFFVKETTDSEWKPVENSASWIKQIAELNNVPLQKAVKQVKEDPNEAAMAELQKTMKKKKSGFFNIPLPKIFQKNK